MTDLAVSKYLGKRRGRDGWAQLVSGQRASGLTVPNYCDREGVSVASFYRWRTLIGDVPSRSASKRSRSIESRGDSFVDLGMMGEVAVAANGPAPTESGARLEVRLDLGDGIVLTVRRG